MLVRFGLIMAALASFLLVLAGCGGAGSGTPGDATGGFKLTIQWPTPDRHIPSLATRIHLSIDQAGVPTPGGSFDLTKPTDGSTTTSVTIKDLPVAVPLSFHARAFGPQADTTEVLLGTVDSTVVLVKGTANIVVLDLATTVDHLTVTSGEFESGTLTVAPGKNSQLMVEGRTAGPTSALVPIDTTKLRFAASGTGFTVSDTGLVRGTAFGAGAVDVTDLDSGKTTLVPVTIKSPVRTLEIGTAGAISIVNHNSLLALKPLVKALDKNGSVVSDAKFTFTVTGSSLSLDASSTLLGADAGIVVGDGTIATGVVQVAVEDSTLTAQATVNVLAHGAVTALTLSPDSFASEINFSVVSNFISANVMTAATPDDPADFEILANDGFGNRVPLADGDVEFTIPKAAQSKYLLSPIPSGVQIDVKDLAHTASANLTANHKGSGVKLVIKVTTGGII